MWSVEAGQHVVQRDAARSASAAGEAAMCARVNFRAEVLPLEINACDSVSSSALNAA